MVGVVDVSIGLLAALAVAGLAVYLYRTHRDLTDARDDCEQRWGNLEALLDRYYEEVETLMDRTAAYLGYRHDVLRELSGARRRGARSASPAEQAAAVATIEASLPDLRRLAEEHPDLRDDDRFQETDDTIRRLDDRLGNRRSLYNEAVAAYNARLRSPGGRLLGLAVGYGPREPFESPE